MKINKKILTEAKLIEAEDGSEIGIVDLDDATPAEVADAVQAGIEDESNGKVVLSDKEADNTAEVVKDIADDIDSDTLVTAASRNTLTEALDEALEDSLYWKKRDPDSKGKNVLVTGLPGSGKTAVVYDWAKNNNVNIFYIDAKNNDLEAFINGYTVRDAENPKAVTQAWSNTLAPLDRENSVLFLDELNRQTKVNIRGSLYSLINEHAIAGEDKDGRKKFKNLLFTIACINPSIPSDKGASPLSDAELSRFTYHVNFDSNIESAIDYFTKRFDAEKLKNDYLFKKGEKDEELYLEDAARIERQKNLSLFILADNDFNFDSRDDLDDLAGDYLDPHTMFNQRTFTDAIEVSRGYKDKFLRYVKNASNFLKKDIDMLESILLGYSDPVFKKTAGSTNINAANFDTSDETDTDLFNNSQAKPVVSSTDAKTIIKNALANVKFI